MAKFKMLSFDQKVFLWHLTSSCNVQCVYIVYTKYQDVSVNAVEQVEFPVHAVPMQH